MHHAARSRILAVVLLAGVLPCLTSLAAHLLFGNTPYVQEPLHEWFELAGSCIALGVAMLLLLRLRHEPTSPHLLWVVAALVAMGLLDMTHGIAHFGVEWSWLRHGSTLAGGVLFGLVWMPMPAALMRRRQLFAILMAGLVLGVSATLWSRSDWLPIPWGPEGYTLAPKVTNALGGLGFLAAALFFCRRHLRLQHAEDLAFASHTLLFGTAGLLFAFSEVWAAGWWVWHAARLAAYGIILVAAYEMVAALHQRIARHAQELEDRVQARTAELRESEEKLRSAFVSATIGFAMTTPDGRFVDANPAYCRITGYSIEELRTPTFPRLIHPDDHANNLVLIDQMLGGAIADFTVENRYVRKGGQPVWVRKSVSLVRDAQGAPQWIIALIEDITEAKQTEEALRSSEEARMVAEAVRAERQRLLEVLETLPAMIALLTPDHHVAFANRGFRDRFGEANGRRCFEYCFGRAEPCEFCESFSVLETGRAHQWELASPDGSVLDAHAFLFTDADGSPMILEMEIDVTERKRAERELQSAHESLAARAAQLRALAGELTLSEQRERRRLARILHDHLQQLLVAAKFRTAILGRLGDDLAREAAAEIERLLDASITASRSLTAELSPPILHEGGLPAGLEWLARWMADHHGLVVDLSIEDGLPPLAEDIRVLLFESVRELLFNAAKHAQVGSACVNVRQIAGEDIRITVSDNGPGFDPATLEKAGETGGGFGLFGIRERLDLLGGRLDIDSATGKGSRFILTAPLGHAGVAEPLAVVATPPLAPADDRPARPGSPRRGTAIRVLLADDHALMREGLRRLLSQEPDIQIAGEAADGQEAVTLAGKILPDVILMDVSMPKLNGVEATRAIHNDYPEIRIIGLSMFEEAQGAQAMRDAGAVTYLTKSGPSSNLIAAIRGARQQPEHAEGPPTLAGPAKAIG